MFKTFSLKAKLSNAFKMADVSHTVQHKDSVRKRYPAILNAKENDEYILYAFMIPPGMNPKDFSKKEYIFTQIFGSSYELKGDGLKYSLKIHKKKLEKELKYKFEEIEAIIKQEGFHMPIVAGMDPSGEMRVYDATNNPNLLIFGEPGSGKSSILHVILTTLIQFFSPKEFNLYLADFKQNELCVYEGVEHVKNVSYLVDSFAPVLKLLKNELTIRGELLKNNRVRHINKLPKDKKPPYIVLCIDEFVMIKNDDIMADLLQIASLGRAYGIYLILSMQRPSHKILSTDVRGVLSVRMGFRTVDLRNAMIGETPGSEKINEPGKYLLNLDALTPIKAPYLNEDDVEKILDVFRCPNPPEVANPPLKAPEDDESYEDVLGGLDE
ncbi:DNA translocase FtsK [Bacillus idriensis]|uniref:DNA translocase FtsK n=1 Tax=Metabacillus idriensis TaxID=324768 RepID=A0A6I2MH88_9BACI|nr:FtsK/SpoIIIE domain-containing protein [Metabacillus idriensis]MRX56734.1 DNA translocase FtsK [Metabacillus idriensis]